jgi:hypothetical protein
MRSHQSAEVIGDAATLVARPVKELTEHLARLVERARVSLVMINSSTERAFVGSTCIYGMSWSVSRIEKASIQVLVTLGNTCSERYSKPLPMDLELRPVVCH